MAVGIPAAGFYCAHKGAPKGETMQVYDEANALARAIRESEECRAYRQLKEEMDGNETARALLKAVSYTHLTLPTKA